VARRAVARIEGVDYRELPYTEVEAVFIATLYFAVPFRVAFFAAPSASLPPSDPYRGILTLFESVRQEVRPGFVFPRVEFPLLLRVIE
jgi:hypothetical protein